MNPLRFTYYVAPALLLGLLFFSCKKTDEERPQGTPPPVSADVRVVATINGEPITLAEFQERFARSGVKPEEGVELEIKKDFLNRLIERIMLLREAQRRRIKVGLPEINRRIQTLRTENDENVKDTLASQGIDFEKWKADIWEELMIERLLARVLNKHVTVSSREVRRYYKDNPQEFEKPQQVRVRQIVVSTEEEAQKVMASLKAGADFSAVAREKSTAPEAEKGGDLGYFARGEMPSEFNVVFSLQKGAITGPVKSPYGYHIFRLEDRRKAGTVGFEEAYKEIAEKLRREKEDKSYNTWLTALRSRTKFEVNYAALE
jgi:peptidyl-prolyl cis-trans isomerase C